MATTVVLLIGTGVAIVPALQVCYAKRHLCRSSIHRISSGVSTPSISRL